MTRYYRSAASQMRASPQLYRNGDKMKKTIIEYFETTAKTYPQNVAVADLDNQLTYQQLRTMARNVACQIAAHNIRHKPIALFLKRGTSLPAAMMSVLYSGNFYVVLDFESPRQRIEKILDTLSPAMIIYESEFQDIVDCFDDSICKFNFENALEADLHDDKILEDIQRTATSSDPAYALFTSGSTGVPKGALLTHMNVISYIHWFTDCFHINSDTIFGSQTSLYFSMSVSDFYGSMFTGATYQIIPKTYFAFPAKLVSFMDQRNINTIYWVPSALGIAAKFDLFKYCLPKTLTTVLFAGEVMPVKYLNYWRKYLPDVLYANLFGPTETTDICSYYIVDRDFEQTQSLPIGIACDNCKLFLIDQDGKEVLDHAVGELYVGGPFVASGYFCNPSKTNEAFVQNPLHSNYPEIVYRTGDLVHRNEYGELEYVGRKDFQIKHLGYRIELSEIEAALNSAEHVELTICVYDAQADRLLLAYESQYDLDSQLNEVAQAALPHYMRPSEFKRFDAFPKNANGKIDRKEILNTILNINGGVNHGTNL